MTTIVEWIGASLRDHPELAMFLALATGYLLGRVRMGSFKLGPVVGCLLAGITVGQIGIVVPGVLGRTFFLLFLFSIGYKTGPQFFRGFGRGALPQVALTLLFDVTGFLIAHNSCWPLHLPGASGHSTGDMRGERYIFPWFSCASRESRKPCASLRLRG